MQEADVRYYSDSIRSYMVLPCGNMLEEAGYPVHMLESNDIPGILPVSVRTIEQETLLYFDITAKVSLANLYGGTIPPETALAVLKSLIRLQHSLSDYLLDVRLVLYSPEFVYCDLDREEFSFAYGPGDAEREGSPYAPLMDFLADHADTSDRTMTELCYRLATLAMRPEFMLREEMISCMIPDFWDGRSEEASSGRNRSFAGAGAGAANSPAGSVNRSSGGNRMSGETFGTGGPEEGEERMSKDALLREAYVQFGDPEPEEPSRADGEEGGSAGRVESDDRFNERPRRGRRAVPLSESSLRRRIWISFLIGASSVIGAGALFILYLLLPLNAAQQFAAIGAMAVCLIAAVAAGAVGVRYAFIDPPAPEEKAPEDVPASPEFIREEEPEPSGGRGRVFGVSGGRDSGERSAFSSFREGGESFDSYRGERTRTAGSYAADRYPEEWLKRDPEPVKEAAEEKNGSAPEQGKLYGTGFARGRRIDLASLPQTVGSLPGFASYVIKDDSVGQIHARIERTDGGKLKVTDLNSPTGTFINGERLKPNSTEELYPQDEIRFGRMEFCYRVV